MVEFLAYPKTPRLYGRDVNETTVIITEKIDGSNGCLQILDDGTVVAQSRKRLLTPGSDNFGFAKWAADNQKELFETLGVGVHYGEWCGSGINRGYGLRNGERRFLLFNTHRWKPESLSGGPKELGVVPVLYKGPWHSTCVLDALTGLQETGSVAFPGFMNPEGVIMFHVRAGKVFKAFPEDLVMERNVIGEAVQGQQHRWDH